MKHLKNFNLFESHNNNLPPMDQQELYNYCMDQLEPYIFAVSLLNRHESTWNSIIDLESWEEYSSQYKDGKPYLSKKNYTDLLSEYFKILEKNPGQQELDYFYRCFLVGDEEQYQYEYHAKSKKSLESLTKTWELPLKNVLYMKALIDIYFFPNKELLPKWETIQKRII